MSISNKPPSKSVFIGNIPYGLTEEQIVDIFSSAGKVLSFRLVYDRETGRPKGFGFAEYPDSDSASSAVRNLNDYEIMNRKLRVDFSNDGDGDDNSNNNTAQPNYQLPPPPPPVNGGYGVPHPVAQSASSLPPLPVGQDLPEGLSCPDAISRTLHTLPPRQLLDVLSQMKTLTSTDPQKATELLHQAPQLSYAIFQALLLMGLVSTDALASVVESASKPTVPPQLEHYVQAAPGSYPPGFPPPPPHMSGQLGLQIGTPPTQSQHLYPPPPPQRVPQPEPQAPAPVDDNAALIQQLLSMPQDVIDQLPPAERAQLMAFRSQYGR
ncbi:hypothetical protein B0O99DRAFT_528443 [Bisporella sp. PMI_857]|nr:hypothetical protein B0O99DRAFT_528443 [Bisporella sp. PMI_857]